MKLFMNIIFVAALCLPGCWKFVEHENVPPFKYVAPLEKRTTRSDLLAAVTGSTYYLAGTGSDTTGDGTSGNPWRSLEKVQSVVKSGDCVMLGNGNYGVFTDMTSHTDWVTYLNTSGATPEFDGIRLRDNPVAIYHSLKLRFYGIKFEPAYVDPASSGQPGASLPQYKISDSYTYAPTELPIDCSYVKDIEFYNCEVVGQNKHLTQKGFNINHVANVRIEGCHIHKVSGGITYSNTTESLFYYNHIHEIASTHIQDGGYSSNIVIEGNHAHDRNWNFSEDWCPRVESSWYHGSYVSIRSCNLIIRNNIFHDGGGSSGMMFYGSNGAKVYRNILIENNLIYDTHSNLVMRIYRLGDNVILRNNTLVGRQRVTAVGAREYNTVLSLHHVADGYDGSGLRLYNNVFVGICSFGAWKSTIVESNNIYWSIENDQHIFYQEDDLISNSRVITHDSNPSSYFETGFFMQDLDVSWRDMNNYIPEENPNPLGNGLPPGNRYQLKSGSEAINFGDFLLGPEKSLGSLDADSFIQINGTKRDQEDHHSAGCYEF